MDGSVKLLANVKSESLCGVYIMRGCVHVLIDSLS